MPNKEYLNFLAVLLYNYRAKHFWVILISIILVAIISSTIFVTSSIKRDIFLTLNSQSDFIVQKYKAGKVLNAPLIWVDEFSEINGVKSSTPRVYGMHFYEPSETYFMIVGIDFFDKSVLKSLQKLFDKMDIAEFLSRDNMIIGSGVKELFDYYEYKDSYSFRPPDRTVKKVYFHSEFPKDTQIITNDMIIMDIDLAREILGLEDDEVTDIAIEVPNPLELEMVKTKLVVSHFNMRIIAKEDISKYYENLFNYKGGVFLALYLISLITFLLILYQRYSTIVHSDAKEIAILRLSGWKISDVIWLKLSENFIISVSSYMIGVIIAYFYVYILNAPLIKEIFLGFNNLNNSVAFSPNIDIASLVLIFLIFVIPFMLVILIPVWRVAISEPYEVLR
ncbi:MAG: FtsX-like permease family protein [Campylobacterota bacterium]|nr:FtsX-like permease family protein [Campylobacterota bacterium]